MKPDGSFRSLQTYMVLKQRINKKIQVGVLDPYKLTWFSNIYYTTHSSTCVLDPYKLTWFSNQVAGLYIYEHVLDPYKLTWFSNN